MISKRWASETARGTAPVKARQELREIFSLCDSDCLSDTHNRLCHVCEEYKHTVGDVAPNSHADGGDGGAGWQVIRDSKAVPVFVGVFAATLAAADDHAKASTSHAVGSAAVSMAAAVAEEGGTSAANLLKQWWRAALNAAGALEQLCTFGQKQVQPEVCPLLHC